MKTTMKKMVLLFVTLFLLWSCNLDQPSPLKSSPTSTADRGCPGDCGEVLTTCQAGCMEAVGGNPGNNPEWFTQCMNSCVNNEFAECLRNQPDIPPVYVYAEPGHTICYLDVDEHLYYVEAEFYTADRYVDTSCRSYPDRYKLRKIASVRANYWSIGSMEGKVTRKMEELIAQGYIPTFTDIKCDCCPRLRL